MTNQQILETAIQKAIDNGWRGGKELNFGGDWMGAPPKLEVTAPFSPDSPRIMCTTGGVDNRVQYYPPTVAIFNHDFAKALWKDVDFDPTDTDLWEGDGYTSALFHGEAWQFHIQNMVIADDPIEYLGENL